MKNILFLFLILFLTSCSTIKKKIEQNSTIDNTIKEDNINIQDINNIEEEMLKFQNDKINNNQYYNEVNMSFNEFEIIEPITTLKGEVITYEVKIPKIEYIKLKKTKKTKKRN